MRKLILLAFAALTLTTQAQTYISNGSEVYGTWTKKGSPYIIEGEAIVPVGKVLTIKPGVVVKFKTGTERKYYGNSDFDLGFLRVRGQLIAKGKAKEMIVFTRDGSDGNWGVIYIDSGEKESILMYCKIEYAYNILKIRYDDNATGAVTFHNTKGKIQNCIIANNAWTGLNCKKGAAPIVNHCTIANNKYGIECNSKSKPVIENTIVWDNETAFYTNSDCEPTISYSLIQTRSKPDYYKNEGNMIYAKDPIFLDALGGDFKVGKNSPVVGKAKDKKNIGAL